MADDREKVRPPTTVRLPEALEDEVRASAERNGRKYAAELRVLIERGLHGERPDDDLFGDSAPDADFNRAVGDAVARLTFEADRWSVPSDPNAPRRLDRHTSAVLAAAVNELLHEIGSGDALSSEDAARAQDAGRAEARRLLAELRRSQGEPAAGGFPAAIKTQAFMGDLAARLGVKGTGQ